MYKLFLTFFLLAGVLRADALFDKVFENQFQSLQYTREHNRKFLILFSGLPGSGKTTIAKRLEERFHAIRVSSDEAEALFLKFGGSPRLLTSYLPWSVAELSRRAPNHLIILDAACDNYYSAVKKIAQEQGFETFLIRMEVDKEVARGRAKNVQDFERSWIDWQLSGFYNTADFHFPNNGNAESAFLDLVTALSAKIEASTAADVLAPTIFAHVETGLEEYERIRNEILAFDRLEPCAVKDGLSEILPGLYIGNQWAADNRPAWISHVLTVTNHPRPPGGSACIWKSIALSDSPKSNISQYFEETFQFIESTTSAICVHCRVGGSRSPTIVIAYLMKKYNVPFDAAWQFVRKKNPRTGPNRGFVSQLKAYTPLMKSQPKGIPVLQQKVHVIAR